MAESRGRDGDPVKGESAGGVSPPAGGYGGPPPEIF